MTIIVSIMIANASLPFHIRCLSTCLGLLAALFSAASIAQLVPDYAREDRIAAQVVPDVFDGEVVWLSANERDFYSIYIEVENSKGAVLVLHGRDVSPEDSNVAGPLRVALSENGWSSFAIQLPVLEKGHTYNDYLPILSYAHQRIEAAVNYLRMEGYEKVYIAAHSCGAHMTNDWLNAKGADLIDGYIAMGLGATDKHQPLQTPIPIGQLKIPVLDVYGQNEFPAPLKMVSARQQMLKENGHVHSQQMMIEEANHYFTGYSDALANVVINWLDQTAQ